MIINYYYYHYSNSQIVISRISNLTFKFYKNYHTKNKEHGVMVYTKIKNKTKVNRSVSISTPWLITILSFLCPFRRTRETLVSLPVQERSSRVHLSAYNLVCSSIALLTYTACKAFGNRKSPLPSARRPSHGRYEVVRFNNNFFLCIVNT